MKSTLTYICIAILCLLTSCSVGDFPSEHDRFGVVNGSVTDTAGKPIEHISVTVQFKGETGTETFYSSSEGLFRFDLPLFDKQGQISFVVVLKDIDGEENGGLFQDRVDEITVFEEDYDDFPIFIELPAYRLSHASALESSPQF